MTKSILIKLAAFIALVIYSVIMTDNYMDANKQIRDLKDLNTTTVIQRDSISKVYELDRKQFKALIYEKDSLYTEALKIKDIQIKQLKRISKIIITDTVYVETPPVIEHIPVNNDTIIYFTKPVKCAEINGELRIKNNYADIVFNNIKYNLTIVVTDYHEVIKWYNFRKRKEHGYNLIGFRNHYIHKASAICKELEKELPIEVINIKK